MIKHILHTYLFKILGSVANFALIILISRILGSEGKGVQGVILTTLTLITLITSIVGVGGITYLVPRKPIPALVLSSIIWAFLICILSFLFFTVFKQIHIPYGIHISILAFLISVFQIQTSVLIARKEIEKANWLQLIQMILQLFTIGILFYLDEKNIFSYIIAFYVSTALSIILSFFFTQSFFNFRRLRIKEIYESGASIFRYGIFNQSAIFAQTLSFRYSYYVILYYFSEAEVGIYSIAISIIESIWMLSRSIGLVLHSRIINSEDSVFNGILSLKFIKLGVVLNSFLILGIILLPASFYTWVFGPDFGSVKSIILQLVPGVLAFSLVFITGNYFSGEGKHHISTITSGIGLLITLAGCHIFIPSFGNTGAAVTASISYIITVSIQLGIFKKTNSLRIKDFLITSEDIKYVMQFFTTFSIKN